MQNRKRMVASLLLIGVLLLFTADAQAVMYTFFRISNNASEDLSAQLFVDVTDAGSSQVNFRFTNDVGIASSITDVYFDDGTLLGIASVSGSTGVSFSQLADPADVPGGDPEFVTTDGFSADSDAPPPANGVNSASEFLDITFDLQSGGTIADVLDELADGSLRIGLHVQTIGAQSDSDWYINDGVVPAPGAALLGALGLGVVGYLRRRLS